MFCRCGAGESDVPGHWSPEGGGGAALSGLLPVRGPVHTAGPSCTELSPARAGRRLPAAGDATQVCVFLHFNC